MQNRHETQNKLNESTIYLYGDIGGWFGVDHLEFIKEFNKISADVIHLRVDSGGGDIFAARAIKTAIMQHKAKVIAHIDGLAASAASFLVMGADEIEIVDGGFMMIHNAMSFMDILGYFNKEDLCKLMEDVQKEMDLHEKLNDAIANDYAKKTKKKTKEEICEMMDMTTWMSSAEAMENGFVDRIYDGNPVEGNYDLSIFNNVPEPLNLRNQKEMKRTIEKALRDVGISNKEAKNVLANGYKGLQKIDPAEPQRDVELTAEPILDTHQRDAEPIKPKKKDRIADLLVRAEILAPSTN